MENPGTDSRRGTGVERRREKRSFTLSEPMVELKFPNLPTYQLKLAEISPSGAGIIVRADSKILHLLAVGQQMRVRLISPAGSDRPSGLYGATVQHVSELKEGPFKGHFVVGVSLNRTS